MGRYRNFAAAMSAVLLVVAVGCGGAESSSQKGSAEVTSPASAPTTSIEVSTTEAVDFGAKYTELVGPSNCLGAQLSDALGTLSELSVDDPKAWPLFSESVKPLLGQYAEAVVKFYEGLSAVEWPADVQPSVDTLIGQLATEAANMQAASEVKNIDELVANGPLVTSDENAAGVVRAKLGLQSNVTDNADYCAAAT